MIKSWEVYLAKFDTELDFENLCDHMVHLTQVGLHLQDQTRVIIITNGVVMLH